MERVPYLIVSGKVRIVRESASCVVGVCACVTESGVVGACRAVLAMSLQLSVPVRWREAAETGGALQRHDGGVRSRSHQSR